MILVYGETILACLVYIFLLDQITFKSVIFALWGLWSHFIPLFQGKSRKKYALY